MIPPMCCPEDIIREHDVEPDPRYLEYMKPWDEPEDIPVSLEAVVAQLQEERSDLVIIETGIGQGHITRRLAPLMRPEHDLYWCYEPDDAHRQEITIRDFWVDHLSSCIKQHPTPDHNEMGTADLVIVGSPHPWRLAERYLWEAVQRPDSAFLFTDDLGDPHLQGSRFRGPGGGLVEPYRAVR